MEINQKKLERQTLGANHWQYSKSRGAPRNGCGTLKYYTGVGKTYTAMLIIMKLLAADKSSKIIVIVPTEQLLRDWKNNLKTFLEFDVLRNVQVYTVQYILTNNLRLECKLIVVDELHEFYSEERIRVVNGEFIKFKWNLGLTATTEETDKRSNKLLNIYPIIDEIDEEEARREGYISDYVEYNLGVELNNTERVEYDEVTANVNNFISKFSKFGFPAAQKCLTGDDKYSGFAYATMWAIKNGWRNDLDMTNESEKSIDDLWNPHKIMGYARNLMLATRSRQEIIYRVEEKYKVGIELTTKFNTLKTICFSQSTSFADKLCLLINEHFHSKICVAYHSKLQSQGLTGEDGEYIKYQSGAKKGEVKLFGKKKLRDDAIASIRSGKARIISTASALDKGFDVQDIGLGITFSGTNNPTQYSQRGGRVKRVNPNELDSKKLIINVYTRGTKEEISLRNRQRQGNNIIHWANKVEDIDFQVKVDNGYNLVL